MSSIFVFKRSLISTLTKCINPKHSKNLTRTFASVSTKPKNKSITSELIKTLKIEISAQENSIKEQPEEFDPKLVIKEHDQFLKSKNWNLCHPEGSTFVTLRRRDADLNADISVKFNLVEVVNELSQSEQDEEFDDGEFENDDNIESSSKSNKNDSISEEVDEIDQFISIPFTVEIERDSMPEKVLTFECSLNGDKARSDIIIENVSIIPSKPSESSIYTSPNYSDLDESLKESFDEFVNSMVHSDDLLTFMMDYSVAVEAGMYQNWLSDVNNILKN